MSFSLPLFGHKTYGNKTASLNVAAIQPVEPMRNAYAIVTGFQYTPTNTAHTVTIMRPMGAALLSAAVAAGDTTCTLASNPGTYTNKATANNVIATGDWFMIQLNDGTFYTPVAAAATSTASNTTVSSLTLTLAAFPYAASAGNIVWWFGIAADTNPADNLAHPKFLTPTANTAMALGNTVDAGIAGLVSSFGKSEPLLLHSNNATGAGQFDYVNVAYSSKGGPTVTNCIAPSNWY